MSKVILEHEGRRRLDAAGMEVIKGHFCQNLEEAMAAADDLSYPVVLKVVSPEVIHKSEFGGVRLNIDSREKLEAEYKAMLQGIEDKIPGAQILGVLVLEQVKAQAEVIIGSTTDPQFGPVIMVGLGGIFVEIFKDLSFGIAPVNKKEAMAMLASLRALPILEGARGRVPVNMDKLSDLIVKVSTYVVEEGIREMDLNPVFCLGDDVLVGDVRILLN